MTLSNVVARILAPTIYWKMDDSGAERWLDETDRIILINLVNENKLIKVNAPKEKIWQVLIIDTEIMSME